MTESESKTFDKHVRHGIEDMENEEWDEALEHFDKAYDIDMDAYMVKYYKTYCQIHIGRGGQVLSYSERLSKVVCSTARKILNDDLEYDEMDADLSWVIGSYLDGIDFLIKNAFDEQLNIVKIRNKTISEIEDLIESEDEDFPCSEKQIKKFRKTSASGCYVATCVYGSYDCPEVWVLRRYRDDKLGSSWYGRLFIKTYYAISPTLVKWFGDTKWFKNMWRGKLNRMVEKYKAQGFADTPYEDKNW